MKENIKRLVIVTGTFLLLAGTPIVQENPLGQYLNTLTGTIEAQAATQSARWVGSGDTWKVSDNAGGFLSNTWFQDDVTGHWYMLGDGDGALMYSGLVTDQSTGKTYLLNTNHDGTFGRMVTVDGTYNINGQDVYVTFDQNHTGTFGAITSGLQDVRNTGVAEKSLSSIPTADNETQDTTIKVTPTQASASPKSNMTYTEEYGWLPGSEQQSVEERMGTTFDTSFMGGVARWE